MLNDTFLPNGSEAFAPLCRGLDNDEGLCIIQNAFSDAAGANRTDTVSPPAVCNRTFNVPPFLFEYKFCYVLSGLNVTPISVLVAAIKSQKEKPARPCGSPAPRVKIAGLEARIGCVDGCS